MVIERFRNEQADALANLYYAAIHNIDDCFYSEAEREAWAPTPPDYSWWRERLLRMSPWVALIDGRVAGFIELLYESVNESMADSGVQTAHVDCLYTHPDFQHRGVASGLYAVLLAEVKRLGCSQLTVDASRVAEPFFSARGFRVTRRNLVPLRGQFLVNCSMRLQV